MCKRREAIVHIGANYLNSENNPGRVAKSIVDLVNRMFSEKKESDEWNNSAEELNHHMCKTASIDYKR